MHRESVDAVELKAVDCIAFDRLRKRAPLPPVLRASLNIGPQFYNLVVVFRLSGTE